MYFEDYKVGMIFDEEIEPISFTEEEIIEYGKKYDPRPIHIDREIAAKSRFGRIIAPGSFANMAFWGQWVKTGIDMDGLVAGAWIDGGQWIEPVYADTLYHIKVEITEKKVRREGVDGFVTYKLTAYDPDQQPVLYYEATGLVNYNDK